MGLYQIFNPSGTAQDDQFDDGLAFMPGEDGYSTDAVAAQAAALGKGFTFSLISVPGWHARIEAEQRAAEEDEQAEREAADSAARALADQAAQRQARVAAEAELAAMLDPGSVVRDQINAKFDAMLATLPDRAEDIETLRAVALES